jgi:hypothetical protein
MIVIRFVLTLIVLFSLATVAIAQDTGGALDGTVTDADGNPLGGAMVSAISPALSTPITTTTDPGGYFRLTNLPVGPVILTVNLEGYEAAEIPAIVIRLGRTTSLGPVRLSVESFELPDMVVSGRAIPIDTYSASVGDDLLRGEFEDLPVDRDYRELAKLLPEVTTSFFGDDVSFSGATGLDNRYFVDGMDVTDPFRGVTAMAMPYNFVEAVEVRSGGYEAEYRSSLGGVLNVITPNGRDEVRGSVFGFYTNNRLAGEPRQGAIEPAKGDYSNYDGGVTLSGPIAKGKAWYALAYNPSYTSEEVEVPGTGLHDDVAQRHSFAGKANWRPNQDLSLQLAVVGDPETRDSVGETWYRAHAGAPETFENADPYLGEMKTGGFSGQLSADWFASDNLDLSFDLSYLSQQNYLMPATERGREQRMFIDSATATISDGFPTELDAVSSRLSAGVNSRLYLGDHTVSAGVEYRDNGLDMREFEFGSITQFNAAFYQEFIISIPDEIHNRVPSLFLQDSWRLGARWRLNAGLRWDGQYLIAPDGSTAQTITDQYQPRVGVVFQPGVQGSQRITATFGRFYHDLALYGASLYHNPGSSFKGIGYDHDPRQDPTGGSEFTLPMVVDRTVDLKGQHYDEITLGYQRLLSTDFSVGIRGVYRTLQQGIEDAAVGYEYVWGNPGRGMLSEYPEAKREYQGLTLTAGGSVSSSIEFRTSYVLSRTEGNYAGLFQSDLSVPFPTNGAFDYPETMVDADGLLPNDRTHVFKLSGTWRPDFGLSVGTFFVLASGTPLNVLEAASAGSPSFNFAQPRGTAGRTPTIWDLNFRFTYDLGKALAKSWKARLIVDLFHVGNPREPVVYDQITHFNQDTEGNQIDPNPTYGMVTRYQSPMAVRVGMEFFF